MDTHLHRGGGGGGVIALKEGNVCTSYYTLRDHVHTTGGVPVRGIYNV